jgi:D-alanine-D-alanine ligase-like ATP-grasp enzyme
MQPSIGRGWPAEDAMAAVIDLGFDIEQINVTSRSDLESAVSSRSNILVWPLSYTIGPNINGTLITAVLEQLDIPFVGPNSANLALSSKLAFKTALKARTPYSSPIYQLVDSDITPGDDIGFPAVLKTEYSCNSKGVLAVANPAAFSDAYNFLRHSYGQRVFVERWEREREYTTAYLPPVGNRGALTASLELRLNSDSFYIDNRAKQSNTLLSFSKPVDDTIAYLDHVTKDIARAMDFDGYFRLDVIENTSGMRFPIEINCQPFLTRSGSGQSYFPMAFELSGILTYPDIIGRIIAHALARSQKNTASGLLERYLP